MVCANRVAAVRGRATTKALRFSPNPVHGSLPSNLRPLYTTPMEVRGFVSHTVEKKKKKEKTARLELTQLRGHSNLHHYARLI